MAKGREPVPTTRFGNRDRCNRDAWGALATARANMRWSSLPQPLADGTGRTRRLRRWILNLCAWFDEQHVYSHAKKKTGDVGLTIYEQGQPGPPKTVNEAVEPTG